MLRLIIMDQVGVLVLLMAMRHLINLRKNQIHDRAAALETIMTAACWSPDRKFQFNLIAEDENVCSLCGATPCDDFHQF